MNKIGMTWAVKPEHWDEYRDIHITAAQDWPELLQVFSDHGVHNFQCFAFQHRIFAYLETEHDDILAVFSKVAETAVKKKWDAIVVPWLRPEAVKGCGEMFIELERVFYSP